MDYTISVAAMLVLTVACVYLSGWIARRRGRSTKLWFWLGALFGPVAILAVALLPSIRDEGALTA